MAIIGIKNIKKLLCENENLSLEKITEPEWKKVFINIKKNDCKIHQNRINNKENK